MRDIFVLSLGWLLGLLSPAIVDAIRLRRENARGREALSAELSQVSELLVFAAFHAHKAGGNIDRPFLEWLRTNLKGDKSSAAASLRAAVDAGLAIPDDQLGQVAALMATPSDKVTVLQVYPAPLLDSRVSALWSFETEYQRQLLEIHKDLSLLAEIVQQSREFARLTFNELSSANRELVAGNLRQSYLNYAERARIVVDHVRRLNNVGA